MASSTVPNVLQRFQDSAKAYLEHIVGSIDSNVGVAQRLDVDSQATAPVRDDAELYKAIRALEALALPFHKIENSAAVTTEKTTKVALELVQSLQHWRELQFASVRALEKSMDPDSSYAGNSKRAKTSENHSDNPVCEKLLIGIEEVFLNAVLAVLNGSNPSYAAAVIPSSAVARETTDDSVPAPVLFGQGNDGTGSIVLLLEQSWAFFTDPPTAIMMNIFAAQRSRCESLHSKILGHISAGHLDRVTSRMLFGAKDMVEKAKSSTDKTLAKDHVMKILRGLRHIRIGVETTERAQQAHVFLSEIIPYTLKKITKDVKIRHVALQCMGDVLARLSKSAHIHLKTHEGRRLGLWTGILESSCGAGSSVARATGKRKYKSSRPYLWPVLTAALCCAPPEVFRLGVSQHIEQLVQTAQDPQLTSMALKCIQDTVEAFLIYHTSGVKADVVFDVLQDTARLLICDNSPPKLNDESVKIFADIIQVVSKHNFDFAMLNMVVALIKQGVEDSREVLTKQMKQFQHSKFKVKNYQDFISPNFSWKVEVALVALSKASKDNLETDTGNTFTSMVDLYVDTLAECFAFVCESSFPFITNSFHANCRDERDTSECRDTTIRWSDRDINIFQLTLQCLPCALPILCDENQEDKEISNANLSFEALSLILIMAEQLHPFELVRTQAKNTLLQIYDPEHCNVNDECSTRMPGVSQICSGLHCIIQFLRSNEKTYVVEEDQESHANMNQIVADIPSQRNGCLAMLNALSNALRTKFAVGETNNLFKKLNEMKQFKAAILTVEAICLNYLCGPDVRYYAQAVAILEDTKVIRGGGTKRTSCDAVHHALPSPENLSVSERLHGIVNRMQTQEMFVWNQEDNFSKSVAAPVLGGWNFQAQWTDTIESLTRFLVEMAKEENENSDSDANDAQKVLHEAFALAMKQRQLIQDDAILLSKSLHVDTHSKASLKLIQERLYRLFWWRNISHFMFSAISTMEFEAAQQLQGEFIQMLSNTCSFDAEHVMKTGSFAIRCKYVNSNGWNNDYSVLMSTLVSILGSIPCTQKNFEPLLNRLWDHEVDVLPEGGGTGERYDDDPADPTKSDGSSWTSKLLGRASALITVSMRRKIMQFALTSIFAKLAKRATVKVWCADVVQSRILSFIRKARALLEGKPRTYADDNIGYEISFERHRTPRIPAILNIRNLYCHLVHDFCAIVNESDRILDRQEHSVLTAPIRASLFETCLEWCTGKPVCNEKEKCVSVHDRERTNLHFASCDAMSVLVQGPPFEQAALKGGTDGFVWAWIDALLLSMPILEDGDENNVERKATNIDCKTGIVSTVYNPLAQRIATGAVESILKSNSLATVVSVVIERIHSNSNTKFSHLTYGYLNALRRAFETVLPCPLVADKENIELLSSLLFVVLLKCGHRDVKIRQASFGLLDMVFHLLQVSGSTQKHGEDISISRERLRTMCCPEYTYPTKIDSSQRAASLLVYSTLGNLLPREAMLKEASIHMTKRRNAMDAVFKLEHAQILDLLKPWVSSPNPVDNTSPGSFNRPLFDEMITLSNLMAGLDERRCAELWQSYLVCCSKRKVVPDVIESLLVIVAGLLKKEFIYSSMHGKSLQMLLTCKLAISTFAGENKFETLDVPAALQAAIKPWDPDASQDMPSLDNGAGNNSENERSIVSRDSLKCDASIILTASLLPLQSTTLHPFLGRVMHIGARGIFSTSRLIQLHAKTLLVNCCRSMDRVDCVKILNEMFESIQHGDTAQNSKVALDGIVASLVGGRDDEKKVLGLLASELVGAAHLECLALPQDGTATLKDMDDIRFSFLFYEVLAPRVSYQTNTLYKLALSLNQALGVAISKSMHKVADEFNDTPHSLLIESIVNAISMTLETMPSEKMLLFPQIVWASVALMKPGTGGLFKIALKLMVHVFEKLNPVENSVMRDVVEACLPETFKNQVRDHDSLEENGKPVALNTHVFKGVLPTIAIGIGRLETDLCAFKLLSMLMNAPDDMKYFVDTRSHSEVFVVLVTLMMPKLASIYSCSKNEDDFGVIRAAFLALEGYAKAKFPNASVCSVLKNVIGELDTLSSTRALPANGIKNESATAFIKSMTKSLVQDMLKGSKKLFKIFLRMQIHMISGDMALYLPCCVTSLRSVFGAESSLVHSFLEMAGTQLLNDVSDSLTNKLNGDMWEEILPMLHIIALTTPKNKSNTVEDNSLKERMVAHVTNNANRLANETVRDGIHSKNVRLHLTADESSDDEELDENVEGNDENAVTVA